MTTIQSLRDELSRRRGDWRQLCEQAGLSYWWLIKFAQGRIAEPGLGKIERLQKYIEAHPLPLASDESPTKVA